jgi:hypothetical protein
MADMTPQQQARAALIDETYQYLFDEAHKALDEGGSFVPFAAGVRPDGERTHMHVDLPPTHSTPQHHIAALIESLRREASARALDVAGLVFDGGLQTADGEAAAVVVHMETGWGESMQVTIPYERLIATGQIRFKDPMIAPATAEIFLP